MRAEHVRADVDVLERNLCLCSAETDVSVRGAAIGMGFTRWKTM